MAPHVPELNMRGSAKIGIYAFVVLFSAGLAFAGFKLFMGGSYFIAIVMFLCVILAIYWLTRKHSGLDIIKIQNDEIIIKFCKGENPIKEFTIKKGDIHTLALIKTTTSAEGVDVQSLGWQLKDKSKKTLYFSVPDPRTMYMSYQITELEDFCIREAKDFLILKGTPAQLDKDI